MGGSPATTGVPGLPVVSVLQTGRLRLSVALPLRVLLLEPSTGRVGGLNGRWTDVGLSGRRVVLGL